MTAVRWIFTGLPLVVLGMLWLYRFEAFELSMKGIPIGTYFGLAYIFIGLLVVTNKPWSRVLAIIAWLPILIIIPLGTIFAIIAITTLLVDPVKAENLRQAIRTSSPDEVADLVGQAAITRFEIRIYEFDMPLVDELRFPIAEVTGFIEFLETDFAVDLDDEVSASTTSVQDIIDTLTRLQNERFGSA